MTVHTEETACTLPRNEKLSRVKGNGYEEKREFVPVLEVAATNHNGRCGIEIKIDSLRSDKSKSWVVISRGTNKYVTEMSEEGEETHGNV